MRKTKLRGRVGDMRGLVGIERGRQAGFDVTKSASTRAGIPHDHEGGVLFLPAFADIGATRLLTDGVKTVGSHDRLRLGIAFRHRRLDADPVGFLKRGSVGAVRLFRMAQMRSADGVEHDGHAVSKPCCCALYLRTGAASHKAYVGAQSSSAGSPASASFGGWI